MKYNLLTVENIDKVIPFYIDYYNTNEDAEWTYETTHKRIHQVVTREDSFGLILFDGEKSVGFAMGFLGQFDDGQVYHLEEILIAKEYQRQGLGSKLLKEIEKGAKERGAFMMNLDSINDDMHHKFYGSLGYENVTTQISKTKDL